MVISDGNHKEWPMSVVSDEILDKIEKELTMLFDKEHEEVTWEWMLEQGPPQDDDIVWIKNGAYNIAAYAILQTVAEEMQLNEAPISYQGLNREVFNKIMEL